MTDAPVLDAGLRFDPNEPLAAVERPGDGVAENAFDEPHDGQYLCVARLSTKHMGHFHEGFVDVCGVDFKFVLDSGAFPLDSLFDCEELEADVLIEYVLESEVDEDDVLDENNVFPILMILDGLTEGSEIPSICAIDLTPSKSPTTLEGSSSIA